MKIYGLDFTSAPNKRKPLVIVGSQLEGSVLHVESTEEMMSFEEFEKFLEGSGTWVCGMDFPFGQPRALIEHSAGPSLGKATSEKFRVFLGRSSNMR